MGTFRLCLKYFLTCLKIGSISFGGGYGMISMMQRDFVERGGYVTKEEMTDIFALAQSLPGLISLNAVILVGYRKKGFLCALAGSLGIILPAFVFMMLVALAYSNLIANPYVAAAFAGIRAGVVALLVCAVVKLFKSSVKDFFTAAIALVAATLLALSEFLTLTWLSPIYIILAGALAGIIKGYLPKKGKTS